MATLAEHGTLANPITIEPISGFWKGYEPEDWWYSDTLKFDPSLSIEERIIQVWGAPPGTPGVPNLPRDYYLNRGETNPPPSPGYRNYRYPTPPPSPAPAPPPSPVPQLSNTIVNVRETEPMATLDTRVLAPTSVPVSVPITQRRTASTMPVISPPPPTQQADLLGAILGGVGGFVTGGPAGAITGAIAGYGTGGSGGGETPTSPGVVHSTPNSLAPGCPTGYTWNGSQCVQSGIGGTIARILPGGNTGVLPQGSGNYGNAVMGAFGIPALQPAQVGTINGGPILRCPPGAVLGKDNLCYMKGTITNKQRKWPKGPRPLLTGGEMKTLRKVKSLENKVKRAWRAAGSPGQRKCTTRRK